MDRLDRPDRSNRPDGVSLGSQGGQGAGPGLREMLPEGMTLVAPEDPEDPDASALARALAHGHGPHGSDGRKFTRDRGSLVEACCS